MKTCRGGGGGGGGATVYCIYIKGGAKPARGDVSDNLACWLRSVSSVHLFTGREVGGRSYSDSDQTQQQERGLHTVRSKA